MDKLIINTDGASRGNPGRASIGVVVKDATGKLVSTVSRAIGRATNNEAEYQAVIAGLEEAHKQGAKIVMLNVDSELVDRQIRGIYRVKKDNLKILHRRVMELAGKFETFHVKHVLRGRNQEADALANKALDS